MDNQELYSTRQPDLDVMDCPLAIRGAIHDLKAVFDADQVRVVHWNEHYVGIALTVSVNLPTRGPVGNVDIQPLEPILLLLHKAQYPHLAPSVRSDRPNFPASQLPHLNPVRTGQPASLCLHRGSIHDWFAEHTILDLVRRAQDWLRDAASNRLIRQHDRFEPTRPDIERLIGIAVYDTRRIERYVKGRSKGKYGKTYLSCHLLNSDQGASSLDERLVSIRLGKPLPRKNAIAHQEYMLALYRGHRDIPSIAILAWPARNRVRKEYFGVLPHDYDSLLTFAQSLGIPLRKELQRYLTQCTKNPPAMRFSPFLPVILAVRRPQPLIGSGSSIEFLNFLICAVGEWKPNQRGWLPDTPVRFLGHRTPLTPEMAQELSGCQDMDISNRLLLIGSGALGSKVGLHLARAGLTNLTTVDRDELSPHNLVRHGLLAEHLGQNKAVALQKSIEAIFHEYQRNLATKAVPENAFAVLHGNQRKLLTEHTWIADCSASVSVLNMLADENLSVPVMRSEIGHDGKLGFLMIEGENRNPRVDDLQIQLYDLAMDDEKIAAWLQQQKKESSEIGSGLEEITIGLGCSSATMRMADDVISYHASLAAISIKKRWVTDDACAGIQVSHLGDDWSDLGKVNFYEAARVHVLTPLNTPNWKVRLSDKAYRHIQTQMAAKLPNETGGLLIGFIHYKRRTVYVTRALDPPPDSAGFPYAFKMGTHDIPEQLTEIYQCTGGLIHYVGEWHSHPNGAERLSTTDTDAVKQISVHLKRAGIPTHIMIATSNGCYSHLFERETSQKRR